MANKDGDDKIKSTAQEEEEETNNSTNNFSDQIPTGFPDHPFSTLFHTPAPDESRDPQIKTTSNLGGFIHMLDDIQDYNTNSSTPSNLFDMMFQSTPPPPPQPQPPPELASPSGNSTNSISSISSTEMAPQTGEEQEQEQEQDQDEEKSINDSTMSTKHHELKAKKKITKRQRQPRFAFMTKSDVDHLDDGYRWRKYGQKAVKNSPYPRSYYRCTMASCGVKKRVERSSQDSTIVVTTYEGTHAHPCPVTLRTTTTTTIASVMPQAAALTFLGSGAGGLHHFPAPIMSTQPHNNNPSSSSILSAPQLVPFNPNLLYDIDQYYNYNSSSSCPDHPFSISTSQISSSSSSSSMVNVRDHGLLQDMIMPISQIRKDLSDDHHHDHDPQQH